MQIETKFNICDIVFIHGENVIGVVTGVRVLNDNDAVSIRVDYGETSYYFDVTKLTVIKAAEHAK